MAKKTSIRGKHIPQRTCVGCRQVLPKKGLIRLVRSPDGIVLDTSGKAAGRGAYLHEHKECWEKGLKGSLAKALKTELTETDRALLMIYMKNIPDETDNTGRISETIE